MKIILLLLMVGTCFGETNIVSMEILIRKPSTNGTVLRIQSVVPAKTNERVFHKEIHVQHRSSIAPVIIPPLNK